MASPTKKVDKIAQQIDNRFKFSFSQQQDLFDDFARYRALWNSTIDPDSDYPWDYNLHNPIVFSTIRSFVSRVATGNVGVDLQAWTEEERPKTAVNKGLLDWEFQEVQFFLRVARAVFGAALDGKAFLGTGWVFKKEKQIEEEGEDGKPKRKFLIAPKVNRAELVNIRTTDVFVANRNIPDLQEQPWIIIRRWRTIEEMEAINEARGEKVYKNLDQIRSKNLFTRFVDYGHDVHLEDEPGARKKGVLEILEMWDKDENKVYEVVKGHPEFLLREEENPYYHGEYPLIDLTFFPEDDEFWSTGVVRPIEDQIVMIDSVTNQYLTNARQQLNNMWLSGDTQIPEWEFISRPNGVIHTNGDVNQLREVQHKDITTQSLAMLQELKGQAERASGVNDFMASGTPTPGNSTASGLQLEQNNLDQNMRLFMTMLEQVTITRIAKQFLALNKQFITSDQTIRVAGRHGYRNLSLKPDDVSAAFDPIVIPNSTLPQNPLIRVQNLLKLKELADQDQKVNVNTNPIWREIVSTMGMTDLDEIVPSDRDEALEENDLLKKNIVVECEPSDNHDTHIAVHQYALLKEEMKGPEAERLLAHIQDHKLWKLASDPELLEKMTHQQQPAAPPIEQMPPELGGQMGMPMPPMDPAMGMAQPMGLPMGQVQPAVTEQDVMAQLGQALGQAGNPMPGVPVEEGLF